LDLDLRRHPDLARAQRSSLRSLAALLDRAERDGDLEAGPRIAHEFHGQLASAGIAVAPIERVETLEDFLRATAGARHTEDL
jgi:hypothetical protein